MKCYQRFDIAFQGPSPQPSSSALANSQKNSPSMHAMLASGTTSEDWFLILLQFITLPRITPAFLGTDQVTIGNGHTLPIAHNGEKQFSYSFDLGSTDTDTATGIRHGETQGHDKFQKIRIRIRQGHDIIQ